MRMSVTVAEDRSMCVRPEQTVQTAWVDIDLCSLGFRLPMSPEAVENKYRRLLNLGDCAPWPPIVGHWESDRFLVDDGRHDYLAALMLGRDKLFVCWLEAVPAAVEPNPTASRPPLCAGSGTMIASSAAKPGLKLFHDGSPVAQSGFWPRMWRKTGDCRLIVGAARRPPPPATGFDLPQPAILEHEFGQCRLQVEASLIDSRRGFDQFAAPTQRLIPSSTIRKFGHALGRIRRTSVAIASAPSDGPACATSSAKAAGDRENPAWQWIKDEARSVGRPSSLAQSQDSSDVVSGRRRGARQRFDHVVEAPLETLLRGKSIELRRHPGARVENRKHMTDPDSGKSRQLGEAADRNPDRKDRRHSGCNAIGQTRFQPIPFTRPPSFSKVALPRDAA
jgi:hypothetical protein